MYSAPRRLRARSGGVDGFSETQGTCWTGMGRANELPRQRYFESAGAVDVGISRKGAIRLRELVNRVDSARARQGRGRRTSAREDGAAGNRQNEGGKGGRGGEDGRAGGELGWLARAEGQGVPNAANDSAAVLPWGHVRSICGSGLRKGRLAEGRGRRSRELDGELGRKGGVVDGGNGEWMEERAFGVLAARGRWIRKALVVASEEAGGESEDGSDGGAERAGSVAEKLYGDRRIVIRSESASDAANGESAMTGMGDQSGEVHKGWGLMASRSASLA
ncbi:hypothetical protein DFH09DRAFT_1075822 [Mycena vulgaris]|nr:hypothetical protein DFH09DRAFT_1075822 [Mycena vulgaris]